MKKNIKRKLSNLFLFFIIAISCFIGQINAVDGNLAGVVWNVFIIIMALQLTNNKSTREDV
ncbi:hypothetical protein [Staphylococcus pseudintermedius]|uniref:hypothetical protein n=1 Tax=Staphylococcus pseudintermedius TaxID=283734 RepID=UPI0015F20B20|nr:hypothetical protein [Staphylococcus pseudintermedius]EHT7970099.1 hypothetical protein [Staphylococcus pseudintermedius]EII6327551.1 hypothetical protein [Staphylococcus pseudintermedius]EJA1907053.1 hypothetical protein [Staphylococcus pseudintermedius]MCE5445961.1 hypothetical protein [Staphylococcus pseudintermedius]MCE5595331.1 hypothetical protein [Staphylococcus pseudintermedius]